MFVEPLPEGEVTTSQLVLHQSAEEESELHYTLYMYTTLHPQYPIQIICICTYMYYTFRIYSAQCTYPAELLSGDHALAEIFFSS